MVQSAGESDPCSSVVVVPGHGVHADALCQYVPIGQNAHGPARGHIPSHGCLATTKQPWLFAQQHCCNPCVRASVHSTMTTNGVPHLSRNGHTSHTTGQPHPHAQRDSTCAASTAT
eukprot:m.1503581 g.1503581  ORF g.1503581 m.1503581 type:complete len:116 (-) comp25207_c0_seq73:42-389(-)